MTALFTPKATKWSRHLCRRSEPERRKGWSAHDYGAFGLLRYEVIVRKRLACWRSIGGADTETVDVSVNIVLGLSGTRSNRTYEYVRRAGELLRKGEVGETACDLSLIHI